MRYLVALAYLLLSNGILAQIYITPVRPTANTAGGNPLQVAIKVSSVYQIDSAKASVLNRQTLLVYNTSTYNFEGSISLTGLAEGTTYRLALDVVDITGAHKRDTIPFVYDLPPIVTIDSSLNFSVARPTLPVSLKWQDIDSCRIVIFNETSAGYTSLYDARHKDSLNTTLNLINAANLETVLTIFVYDKRNQYISTRRHIFVDTSSLYVQNYMSDKPIRDFNYGQLLVADTSLGNPKIIQLATNQQSVIPYRLFMTSSASTGFVRFNPALITPTGSVIVGYDSSNYTQPSAFSRVYDWNGDIMYNVGQVESLSSLVVAGDYAIYGAGVRRTFSTHSNLAVSTTAGNNHNSVAPSGLVAFWDNTYNINKYENGVVTRLTTNVGSKWNIYPVTDGTNIVYIRQDASSTNRQYQLRLIQGTTDTLLANYTTLGIADYDYMVNNKFIAYNKIGTSGQKQLWVRDNLGNDAQRSFFGIDSKIEAMNQYGDVLFYLTTSPRPRRYISFRNGPVKEIGSTLGIPFYQNFGWYIAIGKVLYKVNVSNPPLPLKLLDFSVSRREEANLLTWNTESEINASYTIIERSADGINFYEAGKVYSSGTGTSTYRFIDDISRLTSLPVRFYYRLKLVDKDSSYTYSPVREVKNEIVFLLGIYPNPVRQLLHLQVQSPEAASTTATIVDAAGKAVQQVLLSIPKGSSIQQIQISRLIKGYYFLRIKGTIVRFDKL